MQQVNNIPNSLLEARTLPSKRELRQYWEQGLLTPKEYRRIVQGTQVLQPHRQFRSPVHAR